MSDVSGSSGSKGRGMGIPSPLWTWTNDIIAIKHTKITPDIVNSNFFTENFFILITPFFQKLHYFRNPSS